MTHPDEPINVAADSLMFAPTYGLTKLEYFAALAMQGLLSNPHSARYQGDELEEAAVEHAQKLIRALNNSK